jgi:hypothetical protein
MLALIAFGSSFFHPDGCFIFSGHNIAIITFIYTGYCTPSSGLRRSTGLHNLGLRRLPCTVIPLSPKLKISWRQNYRALPKIYTAHAPRRQAKCVSPNVAFAWISLNMDNCQTMSQKELISATDVKGTELAEAVNTLLRKVSRCIF